MRSAHFIPCALLLLAGCSADLGLKTTGGDSDGDLAGDEGAVGLATSDYVVLDIASGELTARRVAPDLSTDSVRQSQIVFRRVDNQFLIAVFEITQAQWQALGGNAPWSTSVPATVVGASAIDPLRPAFGLSYDEIDLTLDAYQSSTGVRLDFPTGNEWRRASTAGSNSFSWGSTEQRATILDHARTADTADGALGPIPVGSLEPNSLNIYDMHGNVWELTDDGTVLRGGSWHDPTYAARGGHAVDASTAGLYADSAHALVGLRPVLRP